jgi:hypothetical protein
MDRGAFLCMRMGEEEFRACCQCRRYCKDSEYVSAHLSLSALFNSGHHDIYGPTSDLSHHDMRQWSRVNDCAGMQPFPNISCRNGLFGRYIDGEIDGEFCGMKC